ncbi:MAG TPA: hypothetical protein VIY47_01255 [Ignavibacteriaceae bacterium]
MADHPTEHGVGSLQNTDADITTHAVDIFRLPVHDESMIGGFTSIIRPVNNSDPFIFRIPAQGMSYLLLAAARLYMVLRVVRGDGTEVTDDDYVSVINLIGNSIWEKIDVEIGGVLVPELGNLFANYKAYLETLLSYSYDAYNSHLQASRFIMDDAREYEDIGVRHKAAVVAGQGIAAQAEVPFKASENQGFITRREMCNNSKRFEVISPVVSDFMQIKKLLPPGVPVSLIFTRARDAFTILSNKPGADFKIEIEDIKLHVRHVNLKPDLTTAHRRLFEIRPACYPIKRTIIKVSAHAPGLTSITLPSCFLGVMPKSLIVALVPSTSFHGSYSKNPYFFPHLNLKSMFIRVNNRQIPSEPFTPDWDNKMYLREYRALFDSTGIAHCDMGNLITPPHFAGGSTLFAFDLTPDECAGRHLHTRDTGWLDVEMYFKEALKASVNVLLFAIFDNVIFIDKHNKVTMDVKPVSGADMR